MTQTFKTYLSIFDINRIIKLSVSYRISYRVHALQLWNSFQKQTQQSSHYVVKIASRVVIVTRTTADKSQSLLSEIS